MKTVKIIWPHVFSSLGKHDQDTTPELPDDDAAALIECGAAEAVKPAKRASRKAPSESEAETEDGADGED